MLYCGLNLEKLLLVCLVVALLGISYSQGTEDRLKQFYDRIKKDDVKRCADHTKLMPSCTECIPGLQKGSGSQACNEFIPASQSIREEIKKLTDERYGHKPVPDRPYGLYPCKESCIFHMCHHSIFSWSFTTPSYPAHISNLCACRS
jgi:hypothetical protein